MMRVQVVGAVLVAGVLGCSMHVHKVVGTRRQGVLVSERRMKAQPPLSRTRFYTTQLVWTLAVVFGGGLFGQLDRSQPV